MAKTTSADAISDSWPSDVYVEKEKSPVPEAIGDSWPSDVSFEKGNVPSSAVGHVPKSKTQAQSGQTSTNTVNDSRSSDISFEKENGPIPTVDDTQDANSDSEPEPEPVHYGKIRWFFVCASLYITSFLYGLDTTIAADIQGNIVENFGQVAKLGWVGGGFVLGAGATILPLGKAYGLFDMKWLFIGSVVMFEAGSALCGGAPSMNALIFGRVWAGVGGSGIYLGNLNIFSHATTLQERPIYLASVGLFFSIGCVLGPVIGGAFADSGATWRWAFYINLVLAAVCAPIYLFGLKSVNPKPDTTRNEKLRRMDWVGVFLNAATFAFFVLAFTFGGAEWEWSAGGTIAFLVLFAVSLVAFCIQQGWTIFTNEQDRIFPVDFLKRRTFWLLAFGTSCGGVAFSIPLYYLPLYYQFVHAEGGVQSAVRLLPLILILIFATMLNGALLPVWGYYMPWYLAAGIFEVIGGAVFYALLDPNTTNAKIYGFSVLLAMGGGLAQQSGYSVATAKAGKHRAADAVSLINVAQIGGVMVTLTIASTMFQNVGYNELSSALAGRGFTPDDLHAALAGQKSTILQSAGPEVKALALAAIVKAIGYEFIYVIAAGGLVVIGALLMKRERLALKMEMAG